MYLSFCNLMYSDYLCSEVNVKFLDLELRDHVQRHDLFAKVTLRGCRTHVRLICERNNVC